MRGFLKDTLESAYHRCDLNKKLLPPLSEALLFVEKLNDRAAIEDSTLTKSASDATRLDNKALQSAIDLLSIDAAAASTRACKQNVVSDSRAFCSYAASLL